MCLGQFLTPKKANPNASNLVKSFGISHVGIRGANVVTSYRPSSNHLPFPDKLSSYHIAAKSPHPHVPHAFPKRTRNNPNRTGITHCSTPSKPPPLSSLFTRRLGPGAISTHFPSFVHVPALV